MNIKNVFIDVIIVKAVKIYVQKMRYELLGL